ncbi:MAG TPA: GNAT family N-acetyltransferase [Streptosporangiaceae bacterium]|jgi:GNAT superfamily N-acetyltransferase|nr:GNAT family N-acetyltransferase [Streptosporangiaceae bacterium]
MPGRFDRLVAAAWPAPYTERFGEWRLRYAAGVTKRANSVLPLGDPGDLQAAIEGAESFYAARDLPAMFSIGDGAWRGLDGALGARGYEVADPTLVMAADLSASTAAAIASGHATASIDDAPSREWLDLWWSVNDRYPDHLDIARRILTGVPASYVRLGGGRAVGRGVAQGEWYGIYCMAVAPAARGRGLGRAVLRTLLEVARSQGARRAYLIVVEGNAAARRLYEQEGFRVAGRYHYRVRA